jgi:predicted RND superfamily exporter protein
MIPTGHPYIANFLENRKQLAGMGNTLRIAVEAKEGSIFDAEYLDTVRQLSDEVFLIPGVDRPYMKSLWAPAVRWTGVTEDGLDGGPVIPDDFDGSPQSLEQVRINVERSGEIGQLVAANYKSSIILVPLQEKIAETGERIDYHALSQRIEQLRAKYESDKVAIHVTGFAKVVGDLIDRSEAGAGVLCRRYRDLHRGAVLVHPMPAQHLAGGVVLDGGGGVAAGFAADAGV